MLPPSPDATNHHPGSPMPMKTRFYYCALLIGLLSQTAENLLAQIPNAGFEQWVQNTEYLPANWVTGKSAQRAGNAGNYSLQLRHSTGEAGTFAAQAELGLNAWQGSPGPGFACTTVPDSIVLLMQWELAAGDTAEILTGFTSGDDLVSLASLLIYGNAGSPSRLAFHAGAGFGQACDSGFILIVTNLPGKAAAGNGMLEIASIALRRNNIILPFPPNADFSVWDSIAVTAPQFYLSTDRLYNENGSNVHLVNRDTRAASGSFALRLETGIVPFAGGTDTLGAGVISTRSANPLDADPYMPSFPVSGRHASLRGKCIVQSAGDTAIAEVNLFYRGDLVGSGIWTGGSTGNDYVDFVADIHYLSAFSGIPDSATLSFFLWGNATQGPQPGSFWLIDDLYFSDFSAGLPGLEAEMMKLRIYPNPAHNHIYAEPGYTTGGDCTLTLRDIQGKPICRTVANPDHHNGRIVLHLKGVPPGIYFTEFQTPQYTKINRIIIQP
jgi:hypothetical protein